MEEELRRIYYDEREPEAFTSFPRIYARVKNKYTKKQVRDWLLRQNAYTLHRASRKKFRRRKTLVHKPFYQIQMDLADMSSLSAENDGIRFLLVIIDCFSRFVWLGTLKTKGGREVANCLNAILESIPSQFTLAQSDLGMEFYAKPVQEVFKKKGIKHFSSFDPRTKSSLAERVIRTLKNRIYRYLTSNNTLRYVDVIQSIVDGYNNSFHRTIKMKPSNVNESNIEEVFHNIYDEKKITKNKSPRIKPGELVRVSRIKAHFSTQGYLPNFTDEYFIVTSIRTLNPVTYKLSDLKGKEVKGTYYEQELQVIKEPETLRVERIVKRRGNRVLVKWMGFPDVDNSWILKSSLKVT